MNISINLSELPGVTAHKILVALASVYAGSAEKQTEVAEKQPAITEPLGIRLLREQKERVARDDQTRSSSNSAAGNADLSAGPVDYSQKTNLSPELSAGPPSNQPLDEYDDQLSGNAQAAATIEQITQAEVTAGNILPAVQHGDLGKDGIPWDARIHAGTKTFMNSGPRKGCYKYKPKISDEIKEQVEAELSGALPPAAQMGASRGSEPMLKIETTSSRPEQIGEVNQHIFDTPGDFPALLKMVTGDVTSHKVPQGATSCITKDLGFANIMALGKDPSKYQKFADTWVALRSMIALSPDVAEQAVNDWPSIKAMLEMAF